MLIYNRDIQTWIKQENNCLYSPIRVFKRRYHSLLMFSNMTFDESLIKENLVVLPFQQTNIQTNRMTHTDIARDKKKLLLLLLLSLLWLRPSLPRPPPLFVIVVSVVVTAEHTPPPSPREPREDLPAVHQRPPCLCL